MSVLYRGLWADHSQKDPEAYFADVRCRFSSWALEDPDAKPLPDGESAVSLSPGRNRSIELRTVADDIGRSGLEAIARDRRLAEATSWTTLVRVVADEGIVHTLVENQMESDDLTIRVSVGRPRIVDELLSIPGKPVLGGSAVFVGVERIPAAGISLLTDILASPTRTLPVIVCSEPGVSTMVRGSSGPTASLPGLQGSLACSPSTAKP